MDKLEELKKELGIVVLTNVNSKQGDEILLFSHKVFGVSKNSSTLSTLVISDAGGVAMVKESREEVLRRIKEAKISGGLDE